ncbi:MAG: UDP-N-acetylmuramoyl-tripeptide--D-alanyl-D-alanine ligase [Coriobacteriia bacterium]|nr:UDP-N-acetylmuramoyl-tripeptide--D-alanyl-D-alanine ligase [Coriobacteriia bacterium]
MRLNAKQIAYATGGTLLVEPMDPRALVTDVCWDSRQVKEGDLYVALPGERVDGNQFVAKALQSGAAAALVTLPIDEATRLLAREMGAAVIEVSDGAAAITDLARTWRPYLRGKVIGLSGSTGKTTTKNLVRDVLSARFTTVATVANQNNELGVPRTILAANPETQAVVVEMGMRGAGQLRSLCDYVRPDWAILTNVGDSHIELLGSKDNIARAKAELPACVPDGLGWAFLNAGDDYFDFVSEQARLEQRHVTCVRYDGTPEAEAKNYAATADEAGPVVWAEDVHLDNQGRPQFTLHAAGFPCIAYGDEGCLFTTCTLTLRGLHNVQNACAAAAVARALGMPLDQIAQALEAAQPEAGRQEVLTAARGFTVINDAYNASPDSMRAALNTLCSMDVRGRRIAVLGDMGELGDYAQACHVGVGEVVASLPIDYVVCVGTLSRHIAQAALDCGMPATKVVQVDTVAGALGQLEGFVEANDAVLVKASHSMGLNRVVEGLVI